MFDRKRPMKTDRKDGAFWRGAHFIAAPYVSAGKDIRQGGLFIGDLWRVIRLRRKASRKIRLYSDKSFDILAMAFDANVAPAEIERRLFNRRIQTRRNTFSYLICGIILLAVWAWEISLKESTTISMLDMMGFLVVAGCFFIAAFFNALINWQVRTRRLGSVGEFLRLEASWWPL